MPGVRTDVRAIMQYMRRALRNHSAARPFMFSVPLGRCVPGLRVLGGMTPAEFAFQMTKRKAARRTGRARDPAAALADTRHPDGNAASAGAAAHGAAAGHAGTA